MNESMRLTAIPQSFGQELFEKEDEAIRGETIKLRFELPNGNEFDFQAQMGCDVEFLKYTLEREFQLPFAQLTLYHKGKVMLDPLSLNDILTPPISDVTIVKVEVDTNKN